MKILMVTYGLNTVGGLQNWQHSFSHELIKKDYDVTLLEMYDYSNLRIDKKVERHWDENIRIIRLNGRIMQRGINSKTLLDSLKAVLDIRMKRRMSVFFNNECFNAIIFTDPNFTFQFFRRTIVANNCLVQYHNSFERFKKTSKIRYYLVKRRHRFFKKLIFLSLGDVNNAVKDGFLADKVDYVTNFINEEPFEKYEKDYSKSSKQILIVSKLASHDKQVDHTLKAFSLIDAKTRAGWKIKIIGDGEIKGELEQLCRTLKIQDFVEFVGYQNRPIKEFFNSEFFVLSSLYEGTPLTLLECVFSNLPVISYECCPSIRSIIENDFNGFVVPLNDIENLSEKMEYLMKQPDTVKTMSQNQNVIKEKYAKDKVLNDWVKLFQKQY